jgi:hypothetical protein
VRARSVAQPALLAFALVLALAAATTSAPAASAAKGLSLGIFDDATTFDPEQRLLDARAAECRCCADVGGAAERVANSVPSR